MYGKDSLGFALASIGKDLRNLTTLRFGQYNITPEQWTLLNQLASVAASNQVELARLINKDQANVTRILDQLERKGWVERKANPVDRRSFLVSITAAGAALCEQLRPVEREISAAVLEGMSLEQAVALKQSLQQVSENIRACKTRWGEF